MLSPSLGWLSSRSCIEAWRSTQTSTVGGDRLTEQKALTVIPRSCSPSRAVMIAILDAKRPRSRRNVSESIIALTSSGVAGIHSQRGAGDIFRFVAEQEFNGVRDVIDFRHPSQRTSSRNLFPRLLAEPSCHFGTDETGRHAIHSDSQRTDFACERTCESDERGFRAAVYRESRVAGGGNNGRNVDDAAALARHHRPHDVLREHQRRQGIDSDQRFDVRVAHRGQYAARSDTGIVDQAEDRSVRGPDLLDKIWKLADASKVERHEPNGASAGRRSVHRFGERFTLAPGHRNHVMPGGPECLRDPEPESAAAAGDDDIRHSAVPAFRKASPPAH